MKAGKFKKQGYEYYTIAANFSLNMDIAGGEDLVLVNCVVEAVDVNGDDASADVTDQGTKAIGLVGDGEQGYLKILIKGGTVALSPYKITFKTGDTTESEGWEQDIFMTIKEI